MDMQIEQSIAALQLRHIKGIFVESSEEACLKIVNLLPREAVVGIGDSTTIRQMGIPQMLQERGTTVLDAYKRQAGKINSKDLQESRFRIQKEATINDVFLTGTNALTQDGRLVNVDGNGNRVAGMFWGHPLSIVVVGRNKIVRDLDEAFHRIRNVIAPNHVRIRSEELGGRKRNTPCVESGECSDCGATDRICNIFTVIEGKPRRTEYHRAMILDQESNILITSHISFEYFLLPSNFTKSRWDGFERGII
jgi:L-lactate utilization protein LutB